MRLETVARCRPVASAMSARELEPWLRRWRRTRERFARRSEAWPAGLDTAPRQTDEIFLPLRHAVTGLYLS